MGYVEEPRFNPHWSVHSFFAWSCFFWITMIVHIVEDQLGAHHTLNAVIMLDIRHPRKKERNGGSTLVLLNRGCVPLGSGLLLRKPWDCNESPVFNKT